jgi:hypothetical protein
MRIGLLTCVMAALSAGALPVAGWQTRDSATLPQAAVAPSGTAVLSGVLTTGTASPRPVARATIHLASPTGASTRVAGTDDAGRFVFDALPAGHFTLSATKPGYVETFYGSAHPGRGPGVSVAVAEGQHVELTLAIVPGAIITGTITDANGRAVPQVPVAVIGVGPRGTSLTPVRGVTDDRGEYRVFGLPPGSYLVSALPPLGKDTARGGVGDILGTTDAELQWARAVGVNGGAPMPPRGRPVAYAPSFYPGTSDPDAAQALPVGIGEERPQVNFAVAAVPTAHIEGTIWDATGQTTTNASVMLHPRRRDRLSPVDTLVAAGVVTMPRGTVSATGFSFVGVPPGDYTIIARSGAFSRAAPAASDAGISWSVTDVTVAGSDLDGLVMRLVPGLRLSGTILFEHTSLTPPTDLTKADLALQPTGSFLGLGSTPRARVAADGSFTFSSVVPWIYTLTATPPTDATGTRWTLKSALLNGRDLADGAFEVKAGTDITGLVITFTDHAAGISGRLIDAAGRPITRYAIVVFPADHSLWQPLSRRIRAVTPATDGSFAVQGLPPGEYAIAAAQDVEATDLDEAGFLDHLLPSACKVMLADGEQKRQDLRIGAHQ